MTQDVRYMFFDTETTGIDAGRKAVDLAIVEVDEDMNEIFRIESLIDPQRPISPEAEAIHGISLDMVKDAPTIDEFVHEILGGKIQEPVVLIGHRISFDEPMFHGIIGDVRNQVCTLEIAQEFIHDTENHKLDTLREVLGFPVEGIAHRAMPDVESAWHLMDYLLPITGRSFAAWCEPALRILQRMPWGKHVGELIIDVPKSYRAWMLGLPKLSPNLRYTLMLLRNAGI